jgi:hypothetical protein
VAEGPQGAAVRGHADGENGQGVLGFTSNINGRGVAGLTTDTIGTGNSYGGWFRADHTNSIAVYGLNYEHPTTITYGYLGGGQYGAYGQYGTSGPHGYFGSSDRGVYGNDGGSGSNYAGYFDGNLYVSGKVGIGTESPDHKLDVVGDRIRLRDSTDPGAKEIELFTTGVAVDLQAENADLWLKSLTGDIIMQGNVGGNVSIGHSNPQEKLDVNGNARFRLIGSGSYNAPVNQTSNGALTTSTSDIRLKTNVENIEDGLEMVKKLQGVRFNWTEEPEGKTRIGLIAQDVQKVLPELTFTNPVDGYMGINYAEITAVLIEAVKEQQQIIEELNKSKTAEIESLRNQLTHLQSLMETVVAQK